MTGKCPEPRPALDLAALRRQQAQGLALSYLFFYDHHAQPDGTPGPGCLSQWWPAPMTISGLLYPTAEHFMMAEKARLFGDNATHNRILQAKGPGSAQRLGRMVHNFAEPTWALARTRIVVQGNLAKFQQHPHLQRYLIRTGSTVLAQASPADRVWGIGFAACASEACNPAAWTGLNLLGFALMTVREHLTTPR